MTSSMSVEFSYLVGTRTHVENKQASIFKIHIYGLHILDSEQYRCLSEQCRICKSLFSSTWPVEPKEH